MKKDILFDLDDTIVALNGSREMCINETLNLFFNGLNVVNFSKNDIRNFRLKYNERDIFKLIRLILLEFNIRNIEISEIQDEFLKLYKTVAVEKEKLLIATELLKKLNKNYDLVIITNRPRKFFDIIWKDRLELYFKNIICFDDYKGIPRKPNSLVITNAIKKLNLNAEFYVGNEENDVIASHDANLKSILIDRENKYKSIENFSIKPNFLLKNINEIKDIFL